MKFIRGVVLLMIAIAATGCCTTPRPSSKLVSVPITGQHTSMWCWAASGEMTMNYQGAAVVQCDEANKRFGRTDCCNAVKPDECVVGGWPEYDKYDFTAVHTTNAPLTWDQVQDELACANRPFAFSWHWLPDHNTGHMMVASGYDVVEGQNMIRVNNPGPWDPTGGGDQYFTTYDDYVSGPDHSHWDDYYQIHKN
jgi:hypothetical protein